MQDFLLVQGETTPCGKQRCVAIFKQTPAKVGQD